jgi:hypothetical protein
LSKKLHDQKMPIERIKEEIIKKFKWRPIVSTLRWREAFDNSPLSGRKPPLDRRGIAPGQSLFHGKPWKYIGATEPEMLKALKEIYG